ncbi:MAG: cereblon family protein [Pseudomonadota bacterium]
MSEVKDPEQSTLDPELKSILDVAQPDPQDLLYCATCGHVITSNAERIMVNGSHDHDLTNPHGFSFHLGCFAQALGCDISGHGEAADSWFMGYMWRLATCANCQNHLGWYFSGVAPGSQDYFYGLILNALTSQPSSDD